MASNIEINDIEMMEIEMEIKELEKTFESTESNESDDSLPSIHISRHEVDEHNWEDWVNFSPDQSFLVEHEIDEEERRVNLWNLSASSLDSLDWAVDWPATDYESG